MNVVPARLEDEGTPFFETSGCVKLSTQRNIQEDQTPRPIYVPLRERPNSRNGKVITELQSSPRAEGG